MTESTMSEDELIQRFAAEILSAGPEGSLPCNLPDEWLDLLSRQSNDLGRNEDDPCITELVAAVIHVLAAKKGPGEVNIQEAELMDCLEKYRLELSIEVISRRTNIKGEPATLETIFTDRKVEFVMRVSGGSSH